MVCQRITFEVINMSNSIDSHEHDIRDILKNLNEHTDIPMQLIENITLHT
jgi:hypothetical protein